MAPRALAALSAILLPHHKTSMKNGQKKSKDRAHDNNVVVSSNPVRTKASPRPSTPNPHSSNSCNTLSGNPNEMDMPSGRNSGRESPLRGRPFTIRPVVNNDGVSTTAPVLLNTTSDVHWAGPHQQEFREYENDLKQLLQQRLLSKDLTTSPEDLEAFIKEPCPAGNVVGLNVAEVLSSTTTLTDCSFDFGGNFERHRDTFALRELRQQKNNPSAMNKMPDEFFRRLSQYIDSETFFALRLSCRCWSAGMVANDATTNHHHHISSPAGRSTTKGSCAASFLPVEILHQIYSYLDPTDFDAARRICRTWMGSSLNSRLLERMLKTAGWWNASLADALGNEMRGLSTKIESEEWLLSKRLATEYSLRPNWGGNGLDDNRLFLPPSEVRSLHDETLSERRGTRSFRSFTLVSEVDFSALGSLESISGEAQRASAALQFTTSICGKYLLVTRDRTIYVYSLSNHTCMTQDVKALCPVTLVSTVDCPNRVLAVSMDTSCGRFAVAALLEERVGLVCCLEDLGTGTRWPKNDGRAWDPVSSALWEYQALRSKSGNPLDSYHHPSSSPTTQPTSPRNISSKGSSSSSSRSRYSTYPPSPRCGSDRGNHPSGGVEGGGGRESDTRATKNLPETGPYSLYHNLCSPNDPPLSVCICAQRRCVAFGCSAAIELHWVDALSGQGLNRWFPTSSWKAGVLYFFPSERQDERQQRLRVICSGLVPTTTTPPFASTPSSAAADHHVWTTDGGEEEEGERDCYNYYNAVPLSDGRHALFVDSSHRPGELCLGIEARNRRSMEIGAPYLQLETRAVFEKPTSAGANTLPRFYAVGRDLSWGARIVVGFGDEVWLYVIAGDWLGMEIEKDDAVLQEDGEEIEDKKKKSVLRVSGIKVGEVQDLVGVGVCADNGGVLVRGISGSMCLVREWKITSSTSMPTATAAATGLPSRKKPVRFWSVRPIGGVVERIDVVEVFMHDAGTPEVEADEDELSPGAGIGEGPRVRFDADGDVIMPDAPPPARTDYVNQDQQEHHQQQGQLSVKLARQYNTEANDNNDEIRIDSDGDVIMKGGESAAGFILGPEFDGMWHQVADYDEDDTFDEGYYSDSGSAGRPWAGTVAIHPACVGFVAGRDDGDDGDDDEGVDVEMVENGGGLWERSRCEVDVLGVRG